MFFTLVVVSFYFVTTQSKWLDASYDAKNHSKSVNTMHFRVQDEEAVLLQWKAMINDYENDE